VARHHRRPALRGAAAGFSLAELLIALAVAGVALSAAATFATTSMSLMRRHQIRLEVRQGLRASTDSLVRDLRLAGACLPATGQFVSLDGDDDGDADAVTIRTGLVQPNLSCIQTSLTAVHAAGTTTLTVSATDGFATARTGYLRHPDGDGEFLTVTGVDEDALTISRGDTAGRDYPVGSGVFAVDERTYALDESDPALPQLTMDVNRSGAVPFAVGISRFDVRYVLERNCPPCDVVDLPADAAEWWLVNQVNVTVTARTVNPVLAGDSYTETRTVQGKPRNLLP
jgi:prepilin-type N-terminal cleavage/methylation domain-containing protein